MSYVALGDRHSTTSVGSSGRCWYAGTPLVTDYDEIAPNAALLVELDDDRIEVAVRTVGTWRFLTHRGDVNTVEDVAALADFFDDLGDARRRCVVKLTLVGTVDLATKTALDALLAHERLLLAGLEIWERRSELVVLPSTEDLSSLELGGFLASALDDLRERAVGTDDDAETARDAIALLYRLARGAP